MAGFENQRARKGKSRCRRTPGCRWLPIELPGFAPFTEASTSRHFPPLPSHRSRDRRALRIRRASPCGARPSRSGFFPSIHRARQIRRGRSPVRDLHEAKLRHEAKSGFRCVVARRQSSPLTADPPGVESAHKYPPRESRRHHAISGVISSRAGPTI
jgi:hypothetical protein